MQLNKKFVLHVVELAGQVDKLNYYQILRLQRTATAGEVRKAYHTQTRLYHPDRYYHLPGGTFKNSIYLIAKRITEAYVTLRDPQKRKFYDQQLDDPEQPSLRYTEKSEKEQKQAKVEETGKTEKGRQLYRQGMSEMKRKNFAGAERTFKMAMAYEPDNEMFKKLAEEAARNIKTDYTVK
jgi:curved DNA-binding protein CbpA